MIWVLTVKDGCGTITWFFDVQQQFEAAQDHAIANDILIVGGTDFISDFGEYENWFKEQK